VELGAPDAPSRMLQATRPSAIFPVHANSKERCVSLGHPCSRFSQACAAWVKALAEQKLEMVFASFHPDISFQDLRTP
jgi:hypothetical protein